MRTEKYEGVHFGMGVRGMTYGIHGHLGGRRCKWRGVGWWSAQTFSRTRTWNWPWELGVVESKETRGLRIEQDQKPWRGSASYECTSLSCMSHGAGQDKLLNTF